MCGILGFVGSNTTNIQRESLCSVIAHRGPDGHGAFQKDNTFLAHSRLSIIDPEGGIQPMVSSDEKFAITYNGEIYNFVELRSELVNFGYIFRTHSDTEVLLNAYRQWGSSCVSRLRGMFAFAIADYEKKKLFLARDHLGIKPLVYSFAGEHFSFCSEIQGLRTLPWVERNLHPNPQGIYELLRFAYTSAPNSAYKEIFKLPPGHWLDIDLNHPTHIIEPIRYWKLEHNPDESLSADDCETLVNLTVRESVKAHLVADVPFGAFLSGGLDSTLVVAYMSEILSDPVHTFSIGFAEEAFDERVYARQAAITLNTIHHEEIVSQDSFELLPKLVKHYGEPFGDSSAVPTWHVSRLARQYVPMVLSGDGGDEFFGGYHSYRSWLDQHYSTKRKLPQWKVLARMVLSRLMPYRYPPKPPPTPLGLWMETIGFYKPHQIQPLLSDEFRECIHWEPDAMHQAIVRTTGMPHLTVARNIDIHTYLPGDILTKVDIASMMLGLEVRTPLTDIRIAELSARIPWHRLIEYHGEELGWTGKLPVRTILSKKFPYNFIHRKKMGFGIPVANWIFADSPLAKYHRERIQSPNALISQWLKPSEVRKIVKHKLGYQTWHLMVLEEWLQQNRF